MKKGFYTFGESGAVSRLLVITGVISCGIATVFFLLGGWEVLTRPYADGNLTYSIWCAFFLLFGIVLLIINFCIHRVCTDIATVLHDIEKSNW